MEEMVCICSKANGVPSVANAQSVLIDETQNVVYADEVKYPSPVSVTSSIIDIHNNNTQDTVDTNVKRAETGRRKSIVSLSEINLKPSKIIALIGVCCVIGLALPSIILYFVQVDPSFDDDMYSFQNFSTVNLSS